MKVAWCVERGMSGAAHQASIIGNNMDIVPIMADEIEVPQSVDTGKNYYVGEGGMRYPINSLVDTIREVDPDVCVFHVMSNVTIEIIHEVSEFCVTVIRAGMNPMELTWANKDASIVSIDYFNSADHIVAASEAAKRKVICMGVGEEHITVVPTSLDLSEENMKEPDRDVQMKISCLGRLEMAKNYAIMVMALHAIQNIEPTICPVLAIAGDGNRKEYIANVADRLKVGAGRVQFYGYINEVDSFLQQSAVMVQPSLTENLSQSVLESVQNGVPVVSSGASWTKEVDSVPTCTHDDPLEWAETLSEILTNDSYRYNLAVEQQEEFSEKYSIEKATGLYNDLFRELVDLYGCYKTDAEVKA